jgi:hypothetical protein
VKLKLIAHNLVSSGLKHREESETGTAEGKQSGYAWFNYATISPMPVEGRINVNTAPARLISSVPGISDTLAENIAAGIDANGRETLKPYRSFADLMEVKGMTLEAFEKAANLIALNSYVYTVDVKAETLKDIDGDGVYNPDYDKVVAFNNKRYIVDIEPSENGTQSAEVLEKY